MKTTKAGSVEKAHPGFADRAAFDAALAGSHAPEIVLLDGLTIRGGVEPGVRFVTVGGGRIELEAKADAPV